MVIQGDLRDSPKGQEPTEHFVLWLPALPSHWAEEGDEQEGAGGSYRVHRKAGRMQRHHLHLWQTTQ